jgi:hypothetical protein
MVAPGGKVIAKVPSRTRSSGLWKSRRSSVKARGPSIVARPVSPVSVRPLPSLAVSASGAAPLERVERRGGHRQGCGRPGPVEWQERRGGPGAITGHEHNDER